MTVSDTIREVITSTSITDPDEVAAKVLSTFDPSDLHAALAEVLPTFVRVTFSRDRMISSAPAEPRPPSRSGKVAAVRNDWERRLLTPVVVAGAWKRFGECTAADLGAIAFELRSKAAQNVAKAHYYDRVAAALPAGGTVSALKADPTEEQVA